VTSDKTPPEEWLFEQPDPVKQYANRLRDEWYREDIKLLRSRIRDLEQQKVEVGKERDRWAKRMKLLEARIRHAAETLDGGFSPPEINEIRKTRGLPIIKQLED